MQINILCICKGNTFRSPIIEAFIRREICARGVSGIAVESAALVFNAAGQPVNPHAKKIMRERDIDLSGHVSRYIGDIGAIDRFGTVLCVLREDVGLFRALFPAYRGRIVIMNEKNGGIPAPFRGQKSAYDESVAVIETEVAKFVSKLLG